MKIEEIEIEKYGFWSDMRYRFPDERVTVIYGSNGSGKSTLSQLIRRMVYHDEKKNNVSKVCDAKSCVRFHLIHNNTEFIVRQNATNSPVQVFLSGDESSNIVPPQHFFDSIYRTEQSPDLLELLVAICGNEGIESLLGNEAISRRLFQSTENPEVKRILRTHRSFYDEKKRWFDVSKKSGKLVELLGEHEKLTEQVEAAARQTETHRELCDCCERLKGSLEDHKNRLSGMQRQLRGHEYLRLVHEPWSQVQSIEHDLSQILDIKDFPHNGLQRLNAIEADLDEQKNVMNRCRTEILEGESERESLRKEMLSAKRLRVLKRRLSRENWFENCEKRLKRLNEKKADLQEKTKQVLDDLGENWTVERLLDVKVGLAVHSELLKVGQKYQNSLARRSRFRKQYKRTLAKYRSVAEEQDAFLKKWEIEDVETAVRETRATLDTLDDYSKLKVRAKEYKHQINSIREQLRRMETSLSLPPWVNAILISFGSVGLLLAVLGIVFGIRTSSLVGTIYALLGTTCLGTSWALKKHFDSVIRKGVDLLYDELNEKEFRLKETQRALKKLQERSEDRLAEYFAEPSDTEMIRLTVNRLAMLERCTIRFERNGERRVRLTKMRNRLQTIQKEADENRQRWCRQLDGIGFSPSLNVQRAYEIWMTVGEAREIAEEWSLLQKKISLLEEKKQIREMRFRETHRRLFGDTDSALLLDEMFRHWRATVDRQSNLRSNHKTACERIEQSELQLRTVRVKTEELQSQRTALMLQAGAVDFEDFLHRNSAVNRRQELADLLEIAKQELDQAAQTESEFAMSQEDLESYDVDANNECIEALSREIEDLSDDLATIREELSETENNILDLENDRTSSALRFSLEQKREEIRDSLRCWISSQISFKAMSVVKNNFEKNSQLPAMLSATQLLDKISSGSLCKLWAPLDGKSLMVENRYREELKLSQLSAGFREQVALAVRLTLLDSIAKNGQHIPLLWDDLFHHMDEEHATVAIDVLLGALPEDQQVIYFTCHRHIVKIFQNHGVPVWNLPTPQSQIVPQRKVG